MSSGHQRIKWRRNIAENFNRLSRVQPVHERYRQTDDRRQTDGRRYIANMNMSSRSLIIEAGLWVRVREAPIEGLIPLNFKLASTRCNSSAKYETFHSKFFLSL